MRPFLIAALLLVATTPAYAIDASAPPDVPKKVEVPFREDSGLITAEYYLATGKYAQALDVAEGVLQRHPECADAYTYKGYAYEKLGDVKKAKDAYSKALEINPSHLGANRYLAGLYLKQGDLNRAMDIVQVIRMTCGDVACQELDELQADINRYRNGQRDEPTASTRHGFVPDNQTRYPN